MKTRLIAAGIVMVIAVAGWRWSQGCSPESAVVEYFRIIKEAEQQMLRTGRAPQEIDVKSRCITYAPDDTPMKAFVWLRLESGRHLGFVVPEMTYTAADSDFDGFPNALLFEELTMLKNQEMQNHLRQFLPNYALHLTRRENAPRS
jgi:hypothetical protein